MTLSILHISDLHRDRDNPLGNAPLLDSLENDRHRYTREESPQVRSPDVIIVSGDIIQGVPPDVSDADERLRDQYTQALEFLNQLTNLLLDGDKQRVIVVPGNHDVSAYHFLKSLEAIDVVPDRKTELVEQLFSSNSTLRWNWPNFKLYEIVNEDLYALRLAAFSNFYSDFYEGTRTYPLDPSLQVDIFDLPEFNVTVAGFCSCYNNDLFSRAGDIHPDCISRTSMRLRESRYQSRLRVAVWHHNTEGSPLHSNYMDPDILHNLIDRGFSIGFHGHQHRPQFIDTRFRHEGDRRMTVISAGTLCGGASYRFGRAYNVVELDVERRTGLLHLREMLNDNLQLPIWGRRSLPPDASGQLKFQFDPPPEPVVRANPQTIALIEAQKLHDAKEYRKASEVLAGLARSEELARRLLLDSFGQLDDMHAIISYFDPPTSATEAIYLVDALWAEKRHDRLRQILNEPIIANSTDPSIVELRTKYTGRLKR